MNKNIENKNAQSTIKRSGHSTTRQTDTRQTDTRQIEEHLENMHKNEEQERCFCAQATGLFVPNRELSYCVAIGFLGLFFVFMAGFFWGQQYVIKDFLHKLNQDSFADRVASSLYVLTDTAMDTISETLPRQESEQDLETSDIDMSEGALVAMDTAIPASLSRGNDTIDTGTNNSSNDDNNGNYGSGNGNNGNYGSDSSDGNDSDAFSFTKNSEDEEVAHQPLYYAQLIGFGTPWAAHQFVNHITKKGFSAKVEKRVSRTTKGKKICWYQVVTDMYTDKVYLEDIVDMLTKQEKLKGVRIVSC